ncbi:MAG: hypothetical protein IJX15_07860 [Ruminiclostridium sp.]|nr:hypothetical protein [Ruminiclostridium sp.]
MYPVSESYKKAIKKNVVNDSVTGTVTLTDGTVIELTDEIIMKGSLRISHELCRDYTIGTFNLGTLKITFFDDNALLRDFSGAEIKIYYNIETEEGIETIPMGIFIADGSSVKRKRSALSLTAYDYGILFDCAVDDDVRIMTGTAESLIRTACARCGAEYGGMDEGLPNTGIYITPSSKQIVSYRDLIQWCAVMLCGYAVIDREGKLKIISARYKVSEADSSDIIIDKYLGSFERNSIYVTDTRSWIASISSYSGDNRKIYKSSITQPDPQAERAIYSIPKNPLLSEKSESECDMINTQWLRFVDGFKQRGINAEIYGDPSLDPGDVMRCYEGDIDQRRSIVGLITGIEWNYRNYQRITCASAQLSDGFPEEEAETAENASPKPVKVTSQLEKRIDTAGVKYTAGEGIGIVGNEIRLARATGHSLGGVMVSGDYTKTGIWLDTGTLSIKPASSGNLGGIKLGDGLVPEIDETEYEPKNGVIKLRLTDGFRVLDDNEETEDPIEQAENLYGGRRIALKPATKAEIGGIIVGDGLDIDEEGVLKVTSEGKTYTAGTGIDISDNDVISVKTGEGIEIDENGAITAQAGIENALFLTEKTLPDFIHQYTEVGYYSGQKMILAEQKPNIVIQGYTAGNINQKALAPVYTSAVLKYLPAQTSAETSDCSIGIEIYSRTDTYTNFIVKVNGTSYGPYQTFNTDNMGFILCWNTIYGESFAPKAPYGCVQLTVYAVMQTASGTLQYNSVSGVGSRHYPFDSKAEYHSAICLAVEENTLTSVSETVTEV